MKQSNRRELSYSPQVSHLMTTDPLTLFEDDTVASLVKLMESQSIRHVPITDQHGILVGLVTQRDFLTIAVSKLAQLPQEELDDLYNGMRMKDIMGRKITTTTPATPLHEAASVMFQNKFGCLPVVDKGRLVGILTESDFVKAFMDWNARFSDV